MSIVAARVYADRIEMSADSISVRDDHIIDQNTSMQKIFFNGAMIVGGCGEAWEALMMGEYISSRTPTSNTMMGILSFIKGFLAWLGPYIPDHKTLANTYLIALGDKLWEVTDGPTIIEVRDYIAIGDGEEFAMGAMFCGHSPHEAVKSACALSCYVAEPIVDELLWRTK